MAIAPKYIYHTRLEPRRFLWWMWEKKVRVIVNYNSAYVSARKRAIFQAKAKHRTGVEVRIAAYTYQGGYRTDHLIWESGKFLDC
jgi:hypothetical protein